MRLFRLGDTAVKCSPLLLVIIPTAIIFDAVGILLTALLSLSLHEACHTLVAHGLGYRVGSIEIEPFGFVAKLETPISSPVDELAIAAAGPVCSFVIAASASAFQQGAASELLCNFSRFNLALGSVNLLPALPLDGGRIIKSLLSFCIRPRTALLLCAVSGIFFGSLLSVAGVMSLKSTEWNLSLLIMGLFLVLAAIKEIRFSKTAQINALMHRRLRMRGGEGLKTVQTAVHDSATLGEALRFCSPGRYNLILVVNDAMRSIGQIDESVLLDGIAKHGVQYPVSELVKRVH